MGAERTYIRIFGTIQDGWDRWVKWGNELATNLQVGLTHCIMSEDPSAIKGTMRRYNLGRAHNMMRDKMVTAVSLYALPVGFTQISFDWTFALIRQRPLDPPHSVFLGCDSDRLSVAKLSELVAQLSTDLTTSYGFGGQLPAQDAPTAYSLGIGTGRQLSGRSYEELRRWSQDLLHERRFERGYFRAVFPVNVLSDAHCQQSFGRTTVLNAIGRGELPGHFVSLGRGITVWTVDQDDCAGATEALSLQHLLV